MKHYDITHGVMQPSPSVAARQVTAITRKHQRTKPSHPTPRRPISQSCVANAHVSPFLWDLTGWQLHH